MSPFKVGKKLATVSSQQNCSESCKCLYLLGAKMIFLYWTIHKSTETVDINKDHFPKLYKTEGKNIK